MTAKYDKHEFPPPFGTTYRVEEMPALQIAGILCMVVAFFERIDQHASMKRYDDWIEHDGLAFGHKRSITFAELYNVVESPQSLLDNTPDDHAVCVGIADSRNRWYLRFRAESEEDEEGPIGAFDLTLLPELARQFELDIAIPEMIAEPSVAYFDRIWDSA